MYVAIPLFVCFFPLRYDVRNRLDDKGQFGLKSNLPYRFTEEEEQFEEMLDQERYLALECDELRVEEGEYVCSMVQLECNLVPRPFLCGQGEGKEGRVW